MNIRPRGQHIVCLQPRPLLRHGDGRAFVEFFFEFELLLRCGCQLHDRAAGSPHRLVVPNFAFVAIVLSHQRGQPPDRLEAHVRVRFAGKLARHLRHVLQPPLTEHLHDLAIPFVVFGRRDLVVRRIDFSDLVAVGKVGDADGDGLLPVAIDGFARQAAEGARLVALRVDVAGDDRRGNGVVRIQQLQRDDRAGVHGKAVVIHGGRLHARLFHQRAIQLAELRVDAELIGDLAELVPVLIDEHPLRLRIDLHEMADDREPLCGVQENQLRTGALDLPPHRFVTALERCPAPVLPGSEQDVRLTGNDVGLLQRHQWTYVESREMALRRDCTIEVASSTRRPISSHCLLRTRSGTARDIPRLTARQPASR